MNTTQEAEYTVAEVAAILGVHEATVRRTIKAQRIEIQRKGGTPMGEITITGAALRDYREANTQRRAA